METRVRFELQFQRPMYNRGELFNYKHQKGYTECSMYGAIVCKILPLFKLVVRKKKLKTRSYAEIPLSVTLALFALNYSPYAYAVCKQSISRSMSHTLNALVCVCARVLRSRKTDTDHRARRVQRASVSLSRIYPPHGRTARELVRALVRHLEFRTHENATVSRGSFEFCFWEKALKLTCT